MISWLKKHIDILIYGMIFVAIIATVIVVVVATINQDKTEDSGLYTPQGEYALIDFGSTSCEPCRRLQPVLAELSGEYGEKIDIVFFDIVNTNEGATLANGYKINVMPTLIFVSGDGHEVKRLLGFQSKEIIEDVFKELGWV